MKKSYHSSAEPIAEAIATRVRLVCPGAPMVACMLACGIGFLPSDDRLDPTLRPQGAARTGQDCDVPTVSDLPKGLATTAEGKRAERNVGGRFTSNNRAGIGDHRSCRAYALLVLSP